MPNSSSFDQDLYNRLKVDISTHKILLETTSENIQQSAEAILKQKIIISSKEGILFLCRSFIDVVSFFPKNIEHLIELFITIQNSKLTDKDNFLYLLPYYITRCIHNREILRLSALYFLRELLHRNSISYNSIINEFNNLPPQFQSINTKIELINDNFEFSHNNDNLNFEENENYQGELIHKLTPFTQANNKKYQILMMFYPEIISKTKTKIDHFLNVQKRFILKPELYHQNFLNKDTISEVIRKDDIDTFQQFVTQNPKMKQKEAKITNLETFELVSILSHEPSFIQYAAYYNSIKIFKYLILNNDDTNDDTTFSLVNFAVAGGSVEIIRILEQKHFKMVEGIVTSIRSYQNQMLIYLLDNFFPQNELDFALMDKSNFREKEENDFLEGFNDKMKFDLNNENNYDYFFNDHDPFKLEYEDQITPENPNDKFRYFNYDSVFRAIVESNNLLALFTLFDYGMKINARDKISKRTLLHWAAQKGKLFLCKLLMSNKYVDFSLLDAYGESAVVYSVKYGKTEIFEEFMKNPKAKSSLKLNDLILLTNYAWVNGLQKITDYLLDNFKFNLLEIIQKSNTEKFTKIVNYFPLVYFLNQIESVLTETFLTDNLVMFAVLANRMTLENSLTFSGDFYYVSDDDKPVEYLRILDSYYYSESERYRFQNLYQGSDYELPFDTGEFTSFDSIHKFFKFHQIDKKQKPRAIIKLKHPLLNKYKK